MPPLSRSSCQCASPGDQDATGPPPRSRCLHARARCRSSREDESCCSSNHPPTSDARSPLLSNEPKGAPCTCHGENPREHGASALKSVDPTSEDPTILIGPGTHPSSTESETRRPSAPAPESESERAAPVATNLEHVAPFSPEDPMSTGLEASSASSRDFCTVCHKAAAVCICALFTFCVQNRTGVTILQHPKEKYHPLGSARIALLGLANVQVIVVPLGSGRDRLAPKNPDSKRTLSGRVGRTRRTTTPGAGGCPSELVRGQSDDAETHASGAACQVSEESVWRQDIEGTCASAVDPEGEMRSEGVGGTSKAHRAPTAAQGAAALGRPKEGSEGDTGPGVPTLVRSEPYTGAPWLACTTTSQGAMGQGRGSGVCTTAQCTDAQGGKCGAVVHEPTGDRVCMGGTQLGTEGCSCPSAVGGCCCQGSVSQHRQHRNAKKWFVVPDPPAKAAPPSPASAEFHSPSSLPAASPSRCASGGGAPLIPDWLHVPPGTALLYPCKDSVELPMVLPSMGDPQNGPGGCNCSRSNGDSGMVLECNRGQPNGCSMAGGDSTGSPSAACSPSAHGDHGCDAACTCSGGSKAAGAGSFPRHLIVLDGTWPKAKRVYKQNPWLEQLPQYHLPPEAIRPSHYGAIRKEPKMDCLSTIEAVVYALKRLEPDTKHLDDLLGVFHSMVDVQIKYMDERGKMPLL